MLGKRQYHKIGPKIVANIRSKLVTDEMRTDRQTGLRGGPLKSWIQTHACRPLSNSLAWPIYCFYFPLTHRGPCPQRMEIEGWRGGSLTRNMHHARRESSLIPSTHFRRPKLSNSRSWGSDTLSGLPWHCTHVYNTPSRHTHYTKT